MKNSRTNNLALLILIASVFGCQTNQKFKMTEVKGLDELFIIEIDRNRIIQECYFMNAEKENNWRHQYILNMLNEKNEVIPVFYPTNQGKPECLAHMKKVNKILRNSARVKMCARGKLEIMTDRNSPPELHDFGPLGKHESPYYALTFDTICNSKECYSISDTWTYTCPDFAK